jgi:hypothetical protein
LAKQNLMIRTALLIFVSLFFSIHAFGQYKTWLGGEGAATNDFYHITDNGNMLRKFAPLVSGIGGVNVRQELLKNFFLEVAVLWTEYEEGVRFHNASGYGSGNAIDAVIIPLHLGKKFNLVKHKLFLAPVVGYSYCINKDYGYDDTSGPNGEGVDPLKNGQSVHYTETEHASFSKTYPLIQTGVDVEFIFLKSAMFFLSVNYYTGMRKVIQEDITYSVDNTAPQTATAVSKGQMLTLGGGLKYAISDLWLRLN